MQLLQISASDLQRFLETPEELLKESEEVQIAIATFPDTPRSLLAVLVNSDYSSVVEAASLHVNWAGEVTGDYQQVVSEVLQNLDLGQNDRLAVELIEFAPVAPCFLSEWVPVSRLIQGLQNEYMPLRYRLQLLERLAGEKKLEARLVVAESSEAPSLLELLAGDLELAVRLTVECNNNCPLEVVELVKSQHGVASDWDADVERLRELGESRWSWIGLTVAQNPFAPEDVLMKLARDEEFKIRLAVAKNPGVSAEVLAVLAESDKEIKAAVVEHPNISEETLHQLFSDYKNVIQNRNDLPVSVLERFFQETFTENTLPWKYKYDYFLLRQPNTPTWILAELANVDLEALRAERLEQEIRANSTPGISNKWVEDDIRYLIDVAKHPQVSAEILEKLLEYPNIKVKLAAALNQKTSEALRIQLLEELINNGEKDIIDVIAGNSHTPLGILDQIADKLTPLNQMTDTLAKFMYALSNNTFNDAENLLGRIRDFIATYQSPEQTLFWLRQDAAFSTAILENWNQLLASLSDSETQALQQLGYFIASACGLGGGFPPQDMQWLGSEAFNSDGTLTANFILYGLLTCGNSGFKGDGEHRAIAAGLISNPNTPLSLRDSLLNQFTEPANSEGKYRHDYDVRIAIAYNPQTSEEQRIEYLQQALSCGDFNVQERIAKNPQTPISVLEFIAQRRRGAIQDVIKNPNAPVAVLRQAAETDNSYTLRLVAENPNTPRDLLRKLASGHNLTKNPSLSRFDIYKIELEMQSERENYEGLELVTKPNSNYDAFSQTNNQQTPTLQSLPRIYNPDTDDLPNLLAEYAQSNNAFVRFVTLLHPVTPEEILNQAANSASWLERYAVAQNQSTPEEIRSRLARDGNRIVRAAANQSL